MLLVAKLQANSYMPTKKKQSILSEIAALHGMMDLSNNLLTYVPKTSEAEMELAELQYATTLLTTVRDRILTRSIAKNGEAIE